MGILKSGILGPVNNKTGSVIGRQHRGQDVITGIRRKSKVVPTAKQKEIRAKFGMLSNFLNNIDSLVKTGFSRYAKRQEPIGIACAYNFTHAFVISNDEFILDYRKLIYSLGHVLIPESPLVSVSEQKIEFSWLLQRRSAYCEFNDMATILVYNPAKKRALKYVAAVERKAQKFVVTLPKDFDGDQVHCYMNFASIDGKLQGKSCYVGALICKV